MARESDVEMAGFLSLKEPSKAMIQEAATAGKYTYNGVAYDRMQLLTVREILEEKREFHTPSKLGSRVSSPQASLAL